jgi:hypothetical protein
VARSFIFRFVSGFILFLFISGLSIRSFARAQSDDSLVWIDEFQTKEPRWDWDYNRGTGYKQIVQLPEAPSALEIGISAGASPSGYSDCSLHENQANHQTGIVEMRLRVSDDNSVPGGGLGTRGWGFWDGNLTTADAAWFWSASPESDPNLVGLRAQVFRDGELLVNEPVEVDMTAWHSYRIELGLDRTTFYVDGVKVASAPFRPKNLQRVELWIDNLALRLHPTSYDARFLAVNTDQSMYIDWIRFLDFVSKPAQLIRISLPIIFW